MVSIVAIGIGCRQLQRRSPHPLAGGIEQRQVAGIVLRRIDTLAPILPTPIAQPEDAGPRIRRVAHDIGDGALLAEMPNRAAAAAANSR